MQGAEALFEKRRLRGIYKNLRINTRSLTARKNIHIIYYVVGRQYDAFRTYGGRTIKSD